MNYRRKNNGQPVTDEVVDQYLKTAAPEVYKEFQKNEQSYRKFRSQTFLESELNGAIVSAVPVQANSRLHWTQEIFHNCGLEEIAELVKPHMTPVEHQVLCQGMIEAMTLREISSFHSMHISSVDRMQKRIRKSILSKIKKGYLLLPGSPLISTQQRETPTGTYVHTYSAPWWRLSAVTVNNEVRVQWQRLIAQDLTVYHKPPHKPPVAALVCDCGHHFVDADKVHDNRMKSYRGYRCPYCNKTWNQEQISEIRR